jgi:hypothetical protein
MGKTWRTKDGGVIRLSHSVFSVLELELESVAAVRSETLAGFSTVMYGISAAVPIPMRLTTPSLFRWPNIGALE